MIELRLPIVADPSEPFVAQLGGREGLPSADLALLVGEFEDRAVYDFGGLAFEVLGARASELAGDVVYVEPGRGVLSRWLRRGSPHNTLLVTERCDQLCVMCSQPPRKTHVDLFAQFEKACALADADAVIGITGGEPTLYKDELFTLLERSLASRPDLSFHVLTNGQHFTEGDLAALRRLPRERVCWGIPLYSDKADLHDAVVAKQGAFERLHQSLAVLMRAGASVELRTVLLRANAANLPSLARHITTHLPFLGVWAIMQLEHIGFARNRWDELYYEHAESFGPVAAAVDLACLRGMPVALYNFPRCTVPAAYRPFAATSISDWKRKYLEACGACGERAICTGFFEWHPASAAEGRIQPL